VESSPFWTWLYDQLTPAGVRVHVAHAKALRAIATSHRKTDERDAMLLARMLATGLIPAVYPKPQPQREQATLLRHRGLLVRRRTECANRIHAQLHTHHLQIGRGKLLRRSGAAWLRAEAWPCLTPEQRRLVRSHWRLIRVLQQMIRHLDREIARRAAHSNAAVALQTIPGLGPYRSLTLATELMPIRRFPDAAHLVSYAGLAPRTRSSGGRTRHGAISPDANRYVRGVLVSAIPSHLRFAPASSLSQYYGRLKARVGWPVARVAAARRLTQVIYHMLATGEAWRG
jgi:transposase